MFHSCVIYSFKCNFVSIQHLLTYILVFDLRPILPDQVAYYWMNINPLTAGAAYIRVFIFYWHIKYHLLNTVKIKCDINQQDLKTVDLHFVKFE